MPTQSSRDEYENVAAFRIALRRFLFETERVTQTHRLTPQRYDLLVVIRGSESASLSIRELAERLSLAPHSVTELVDRAEKVGLVRRAADKRDGRVARVQLTREGRRRLDRVLIALRPERRVLFQLLAEAYERAERLNVRLPPDG
jgi:DNA-binding MarR family transcriptional regulator